jgi:hypothetical protein
MRLTERSGRIDVLSELDQTMEDRVYYDYIL